MAPVIQPDVRCNHFTLVGLWKLDQSKEHSRPNSALTYFLPVDVGVIFLYSVNQFGSVSFKIAWILVVKT